ncbi:endoplasmic reticulum-Golgi intermediate compartment protein 1-like isoform X2 [Watersipora subatra]
MFVTSPSDDAQERITVRISIVVHSMNCQYLGVDIQDDMGRHEVGHVQDVVKTPVSDGCRFKAKFSINKVPGNFHIATHSSKEKPSHGNMKHTVEYLSFGDQLPQAVEDEVPGSFNALKERTSEERSDEMLTHDYFLKIVPSKLEFLSGKAYTPYQYTYAYRNYRGLHAPAIWFRFDLSPITVSYVEKRKPFYHFLTMFCAIIGGTFTVASIIDSMIFTTHSYFKKAEIGKLG